MAYPADAGVVRSPATGTAVALSCTVHILVGIRELARARVVGVRVAQ
jgi:hypothetical protein